MKTSILKSVLALSVLAIVSGCASDPVVTSQTTSTRRVVSQPMESSTVVEQPMAVRQTHSTTTTAY